MSAALRRAGRLLTTLPARILISAALLALVAASIDWTTLSETLGDAAWGWFAVTIGFVLGALVVGAGRWQLLLRAAEIRVPTFTAGRAYFAGAFANNFLPTGFGGDAVRTWLVARGGRALSRAFASVLVDRASALGCSLLLAWVGVALDPGSVPGAIVALLAAASVAAALALAIAVAALRRQGLGRLLPDAVRPWAAEAANAIRDYGGDRRLALGVIVLGLAFQGLMVAAAWALSEALGLGLGPAVLAAVTPLVVLATLAPISLAGFGVREGAFVALLGEVGIASADATLLSLMSVAAIAIASLPGGLAIIGGRVAEDRPAADPAQ